jgi:hypothetical protein
MDTSWVQPLLDAVAKGADPKTVIPNEFVIIRGGIAPQPDPGTIFSGAMGRTLEEAGIGVPHNQIRVTTAGDIRATGGTVELAPEPTAKTGTLNILHVNVNEGGPSCFSDPVPNPAPKDQRFR